MKTREITYKNNQTNETTTSVLTFEVVNNKGIAKIDGKEFEEDNEWLSCTDEYTGIDDLESFVMGNLTDYPEIEIL